MALFFHVYPSWVLACCTARLMFQAALSLVPHVSTLGRTHSLVTLLPQTDLNSVRLTSKVDLPLLACHGLHLMS